MKFISTLLCGTLLAASNLANAGIWYQWHATNHLAPHGISLILEFDPAVVKAGTFQMQLDISDNEYTLDPVYEQSGLLNLSYSGGLGGGIYWKPRKGITDPGPVRLNMNVSFGPGNHLTGHIYAFNFDSQFGMTTDLAKSPHFMIYAAESDAGMNGCGWASAGQTPCYGATGQIRRIPEPASVALLGLGAVGLIATRRRCAKQKAR